MLDLKKEEPKPRLHLGEDATVVLQLLKGKLEKYNGVLVHPKAWRDQWVVSIPHDNKELVVNDCNLDDSDRNHSQLSAQILESSQVPSLSHPILRLPAYQEHLSRSFGKVLVP